MNTIKNETNIMVDKNKKNKKMYLSVFKVVVRKKEILTFSSSSLQDLGKNKSFLEVFLPDNKKQDFKNVKESVWMMNIYI